MSNNFIFFEKIKNKNWRVSRKKKIKDRIRASFETISRKYVRKMALKETEKLLKTIMPDNKIRTTNFQILFVEEN